MSSHFCKTPSLRVGVVTTSFPVVGYSPSGIFVERLLFHMPKGVSVTVLTPCSDSEAPNSDGSPYLLRCFAYGPRRWQRLAHRPGGIPEAMRRRDPALLLLPLFLPAMFFASFRLAGKVDVMHGNWSVPGVVAAVAARMRGRAALVTLRGADVNRAENSQPARWVLAACLYLNRYTVVVSEAMRDGLRLRYPRWADRISFVPNGVSVESVAKRPVLRSSPRLLTVGSLIGRKRIETLLQAVALLQDGLGGTLRVVGDGPELDKLQRMANRLGIGLRVDFAGAVSPNDIERHLHEADIFLFASESEGRPNAILEAMAAEMPIVATDIPGVRELVGEDGGLLFPVGDARALARCVETLLADPVAARSMGCRAGRRIREGGLTWDAAARSYVALYQDAMKHTGRRACVG